MVRELVGRYRELPSAERQRLPALLHSLGKLEVLTGDFEQAQQDFQQVATLVHGADEQAEAHFSAYRAALERRRWDEALAELRRALELDAVRFAPFPLAE